MRRFLAITLVGIGTLTVSGCNFFRGDQDIVSDQPEDVVGGETAPAEEPVAEEFLEPIVPAAPSLAAIASAELIQSTDPDERFRQVQRTRTDPFAELTTPPPQPEVPPQDGVGQPNQPVADGPGAGDTPIATGDVTDSPITSLPELPQPELARSVEVSGVVQVGNAVHAIIRAPNEAGSRYVRVGQRLSNGQILVKRIEMREGAEPIVVLEQNGVEVALPVGSGTEGNTPV